MQACGCLLISIQILSGHSMGSTMLCSIPKWFLYLWRILSNATLLLEMGSSPASIASMSNTQNEWHRNIIIIILR